MKNHDLYGKWWKVEKKDSSNKIIWFNFTLLFKI